ncbi:hypothetical protein Nans01_21030 [Nocardiopsis ansamitocini]|uniref:Uncharacterized protein n=1 Tax=Nocardiopsis ansamitocini TaxID=1670832 RepID=A0A9W6P650_9ACTN|nr:hypothetical protein Nans01_21030 [Nocardiopsis ansamitocini]
MAGLSRFSGVRSAVEPTKKADAGAWCGFGRGAGEEKDTVALPNTAVGKAWALDADLNPTQRDGPDTNRAEIGPGKEPLGPTQGPKKLGPL